MMDVSYFMLLVFQFYSLFMHTHYIDCLVFGNLIRQNPLLLKCTGVCQFLNEKLQTLYFLRFSIKKNVKKK